MNENLKAAVDALIERCEGQASEFRGQTSVTLPPGQIQAACRILRDEFSFEQLAGETAVDYWPEMAPRFHVVYQLHSLSRKLRLGLRVPVSGEQPSVPTLEVVYPNANWFEREIWDMFGIRFEGHSDMRRILLPYDWEGHPLRKDYPLGYEEVQFSFNFEEIDKRKPYAKD